MARNTGNGHRAGAVKDRTQYLTKNGTYMKRGDDGKFISGKSTPYKGITRENKSGCTKNLKK